MYTRVLMGHIDLASVVFSAGTPGYLLDSLALTHLWKVGKTYLHGKVACCDIFLPLYLCVFMMTDAELLVVHVSHGIFNVHATVF
jgi:hypothetical protein